jgi:VWFA-related protein
MWTWKRPAAILGIAFLALAPSAGPRAQQQPVFRSSTELLVVDCRVVDRTGAPVLDLLPPDFTVTVDGKPRRVVSADFVSYETKSAAERTPVVPAVALASAAAPPRPSPPRRTVLILVDEDSMEPGDGLVIKREADKLLDKLQPRDLVGVATIPRLQSQVLFTTDRAAVRKALAVVSPALGPKYALNISLAQALDAIEDRDSVLKKRIINRACTGSEAPPPGAVLPRECAAEAERQISAMQRDARQRGQLFLRALLHVAEALRRVPGPKTMFFISGGAPMPDRMSPMDMSLLPSAFAAADISLYTLFIERSGYSLTRGDVSPAPGADMAVERAGIENATSSIGGTFMTAIGTLDQYFDRFVRELSGLYLLGLEVTPSDRDGRPHLVAVKTNRPNMEVRARKQYVIPHRPTSPPLPGQ